MAIGCPAPSTIENAQSAAEGIAPPEGLSGPSETSSGEAEYTWEPSSTPDVRYELAFRRESDEVLVLGDSGREASGTITFPSDGRFEVHVRACLGVTCSAYAGPVIITVTIPFPSYLDSTCPGPLPSPPAQENVGSVGGSGSVAAGRAGYEIPIVVAPGRGGMVPSVALAYSSAGGQGLAGQGWALSASSKVARCARSPHTDGLTHAVDFSSADRLCLDGERLVLASGSYGADGSTYRLMNETFDVVVLHGDMQGVAGFEVRHRTGHTSHYGAFAGRTDAVELLTDAPAASAWWLTKRVDPQSNSVDYRYTTLDDSTLNGQPVVGQHVLIEVLYTGFAGIPGDRSVRFTYEPRPDKRTSFRAGAMQRRTQRLQAIASYAQGTLVRNYEFDYTESRATRRSLLAEVTACASIPCTTASSLPPTTFTYGDAAPAFVFEDITTDPQDYVRIAHDYDGDGHRDRIYNRIATPCGGAALVSQVEMSGSDTTVNLRGPGAPWRRGFERTIGSISAWGNPDFDQDGRVDFLGVVSTAQGDVFSIRSNGVIKHSDLVMPEHTYNEQVADFDGDGRSDLLWFDGVANYHVSLQIDPAQNGDLRFVESTPAFPLLGDREQVMQVSDFDGNGLPDAYVDWNGVLPKPSGGYEPKIVFTDRVGTAYAFRTATIPSLGGPLGPIEEGELVSSSFSDLGSAYFRDVNGDGLLDIVGGGLYINIGGTFRPGLAQMNGAARRLQRMDKAPPRRLALDYDGDGVEEPIFADGVVHEWCASVYRPTVEYELLYCSSPREGMRTFDHEDAPTEMDRTVHSWSAAERIDDGLGQYDLSVSVPTSIVAHRFASVEDYGGDGLSDVVSYLHRLYPPATGEDYCESEEPSILGYYANPRPALGTKVSRQTGSAPDLLVEVRSGMGSVERWTHAPMSAKTDVLG